MVAAQWIVHEQIGATSRWLLVGGTVKRGAEDVPPADAAYLILREVDRAFAEHSELPVRTLTVPKRYILPEPFAVKVHVESEPAGARLYEITEGGALVALGKTPVDVTYRGSVSDRGVSLMGATWLAPSVDANGLSVQLYATDDKHTSMPTKLELVTAADVDALHHGAKELTRNITLAVQSPIDDNARAAVAAAVTVNAVFLTGADR